MCLVTFAVGEHARYPFVLLANRDERYERPSAALHFWEDQPAVLAGRDLEHGGTWLGLTRSGRFATLTNHPFTDWQPLEAVSRGNLVSDFLKGEMSAEAYLKDLRANRQHYEGYHLIFGTLDMGAGSPQKSSAKRPSDSGLWLYANVEDRVERFGHGLHSVGNTYDDLTHHKEVRSKGLLAGYLGLPVNSKPTSAGGDAARQDPDQHNPAASHRERSELQVDDLIEFFQDRQAASNLTIFPEQLPLEVARQNSSIFIKGDYFGTVGTTVMLIDRKGWVKVKEVRYNQAGIIETTKKKFKLGSSKQNLRPPGQATNEVSE